MVTVNNSDYYNNIPAGRDLNKLPNNSSAGTTVGYQYDGLTEEDRFVQKVLREHYDKMYKENMSHCVHHTLLSHRLHAIKNIGLPLSYLPAN